MEEKIKEELSVIDEKESVMEKVQIVMEWAKEHKYEISISVLSAALILVTGRNIHLNKTNHSLLHLVGQMDAEIGCLSMENESLIKEYYSLASEALRSGSSIGGQILSDVRYNKPTLLS